MSSRSSKYFHKATELLPGVVYCVHRILCLCLHTRSFGPSNLSLIVWLFHLTQRCAEVINIVRKCGVRTLKEERLNEQHSTAQCQHGHNYSALALFCPSAVSYGQASLLAMPFEKCQVKRGASSFPLQRQKNSTARSTSVIT